MFIKVTSQRCSTYELELPYEENKIFWNVPSGFLMFSSASSWSEPSERRASQGV